MIESYGYTSCTSCRKTDGKLKESGVDFVSRDFFRNRFSAEELHDVLDRAGMTPHEVLSKRSKVYKARSAEIDALDDEALFALMLEEPTLLRRPIVIGPSGVVVGHNDTRLHDLIEQTR